jgi:hypothetical protein
MPRSRRFTVVVSSIVAVVLGGSFALAFESPEKVVLAHRFTEPSKRYLTVRTDFEKSTLTPLMTDPITAREKREWWITQQCVPDAAPERANLTWNIDRLQAQDFQMKRENRYDSLLDPRPGPEQAALAVWANRELTFLLTSGGSVADLRGTIVGAPNPRNMPRRQPVMVAPTHDDFSSLIHGIFADYIFGRGLNVGETQTRVRTVRRSPYGTVSGPVRYSITGTETRDGRLIARIAFQGDLNLTPEEPATPPRDDEREHVLRAATYQGALDFDLDAGEPLSFDAREDLALDLIMRARERTTQPAATQPRRQPESYTFRIDERRRWSVSISRTPPPRPIVVTPPPSTTAPHAAERPTRVNVPRQPTTRPTTRPRS